MSHKSVASGLSTSAPMHAFNPLNEDDIGLAYIFQDPGIIGGMHGGTTTASKNELEIKYIISTVERRLIL